MLTREQMEAVIDEGGSVGYKGQIITDKADLPKEAELSRGNSKMAAEARERLAKKIREAEEQLKLIDENEKLDSKKSKSNNKIEVKSDDSGDVEEVESKEEVKSVKAKSSKK